LLSFSLAIPIGFEKTSYTFQEANVPIESVFVSKGGFISEQNLSVIVQYSDVNEAKEGELRIC